MLPAQTDPFVSFQPSPKKLHTSRLQRLPDSRQVIPPWRPPAFLKIDYHAAGDRGARRQFILIHLNESAGGAALRGRYRHKVQRLISSCSKVEYLT